MQFKKILIANRGEIALRIVRACRELGIKTVAVYSEADRDSLHLRYADEAYSIGSSQPSESYLNIKKILEIAKKTSTDAIHPGYGFLAQNPALAEACENNQIEFIGPSSATLRMMGSKTVARMTVAKANVPLIPGTAEPVVDEKEIARVAEDLGFPVLIKAVYGGGGRGMRVVRDKTEIPQAVESARIEAKTSFGNARLYVEKMLEKPRHVEFQVLADKNGVIIHLGERECSIQRRYQKLIEETPSPMMTEKLRKIMGETAVKAAKAAEYVNAGTVEFLVDENGTFYFLEMNTRLQVEHLITEMVTGIDIVKEQIRIAAGEPLSFKQDDVKLYGHAINCRINAEDPYNNFEPCPGTITKYHPPSGLGVRVDSALYEGYTIPVYYDSLIAKLAVWGRTRSETIARMRNALSEYVIEGIETTIPFHKKILEDEQYQLGNIHTNFVQERISNITLAREHEYEDIAVLSAAIATYLQNQKAVRIVTPVRKTATASYWKTRGFWSVDMQCS